MMGKCAPRCHTPEGPASHGTSGVLTATATSIFFCMNYTEAQNGKRTCPRSNDLVELEPGSELGSELAFHWPHLWISTGSPGCLGASWVWKSLCKQIPVCAFSGSFGWRRVLWVNVLASAASITGLAACSTRGGDTSIPSLPPTPAIIIALYPLQ